MKVRRDSAMLAAAVVFSLVPFSLGAQTPQTGAASTTPATPAATTPAATTPAAAKPPANAKEAAPEDLTGQWMAVVTEDWRYRMILPPKNDYAGVPMTFAGKKIADSWDAAKDEASGQQCKSYGAPAVMRTPGRIRISWADEDTLKVEADAGTQTRLFYFKEPKSQGGDWQGRSQATWETRATRNGTGGNNFGGGTNPPPEVPKPPALSGSLQVVTTKLKPGYLRKNGVAYSDKTVLTEYYDRTKEPNGDSWLVVKTIVYDPVYLSQEFITSSHFKKQNDQSGWNPTPCSSR